MTKFTITFESEVEWAEYDIKASTPGKALQRARRLIEDDPEALDFQAFDSRGDIEHIEVRDPLGDPVADWKHPALLVRLAAPDLLAALQQALTALRAAPRFPVPELLSDSYRIADACEQVIANAVGGSDP